MKVMSAVSIMKEVRVQVQLNTRFGIMMMYPESSKKWLAYERVGVVKVLCRQAAFHAGADYRKLRSDADCVEATSAVEDSLAFWISFRIGALFEKGEWTSREIAVLFSGPVVFTIWGWKRRRVKARLVSKN
jgi:hypothetical protein